MTCGAPGVRAASLHDTLHGFLCMVLASQFTVGSVLVMPTSTATWKPVLHHSHLRQAMKEAGIDGISQLSRVAKVHRNTLGPIVNGQAEPTASVVAKIATALHHHPGYFLGWVEK